MATFKSATVNLTTSAQQIYSATNASIVLSMMVSNLTTATTAAVTITKHSNAGTEQTKLVYAVPVPYATTLECVPNKIVLEAGQSIKALSSANSTLDITLSAMET